MLNTPTVTKTAKAAHDGNIVLVANIAWNHSSVLAWAAGYVYCLPGLQAVFTDGLVAYAYYEFMPVQHPYTVQEGLRIFAMKTPHMLTK